MALRVLLRIAFPVLFFFGGHGEGFAGPFRRVVLQRRANRLREFARNRLPLEFSANGIARSSFDGSPRSWYMVAPFFGVGCPVFPLRTASRILLPDGAAHFPEFLAHSVSFLGGSAQMPPFYWAGCHIKTLKGSANLRKRASFWIAARMCLRVCFSEDRSFFGGSFAVFNMVRQWFPFY